MLKKSFILWSLVSFFIGVNQPSHAEGYSPDEATQLATSWITTFLNRNPEPKDKLLATMSDLLVKGTRPNQVLSVLLAGPEYYKLKGNTKETYIRGLFQDVLQQPIPEPVYAEYSSYIDATPGYPGRGNLSFWVCEAMTNKYTFIADAARARAQVWNLKLLRRKTVYGDGAVEEKAEWFRRGDDDKALLAMNVGCDEYFRFATKSLTDLNAKNTAYLTLLYSDLTGTQIPADFLAQELASLNADGSADNRSAIATAIVATIFPDGTSLPF